MGVFRAHWTLVAGTRARRIKVEQHEGVKPEMAVDGDGLQRRRGDPRTVRVGERRLAPEAVVRQPSRTRDHPRDAQTVEDVARDALLLGPQLEVNVRGGLQRVSNHQQCDKGALRKFEQARGVFHVRSHDPFNGADASFEGSEVCLWPQRSVGFVPAMVRGRCGFNGREGHAGKTTWAEAHKEQTGLGQLDRHADAVLTGGPHERHASFEGAERSDRTMAGPFAC